MGAQLQIKPKERPARREERGTEREAVSAEGRVNFTLAGEEKRQIIISEILEICFSCI